ncbi:VCBS domain-containing protein, partial [Candidatus Pelagibacter sp.]|nr:VCBS domain-containing protein [Candidatus Pelagibacter sp.]
MADDSDADDHDSFTVTQIAVTGGSNSSVAGGSSYNSSGTSITGTYGTLTVGADGTYTYTADQDAADALDAGDTVPDSFTYTISDGTATATATLIITVTGINDAPITTNNTVRINENNVDGTHGARTSTNIYHDFVQSEFPYSDVDSDDTGMKRIKISSQTSAGALVNKNDNNEAYDISSPIIFNTSNNSIGALRYVPTAGLEDNQSFSFNVQDSQSTYASQAKTMNIEINSAPVATDHTHGSAVATSGTASSNLILSSANGGVDKIDDVDDESDSSSHVLTITGVAKGAEGSSIPSGSVGSAVTGTYGSLVLNSNGSYTYTANATNNITIGSTASDVFNYTVEDDEGTTGSAGSNALDVGQLTFTVQALANAAPTASDGIIYVNENNQVSSAGDRTPSNISHTFQANDFSLSDINETAQDQSLSIKIITLPSSGTLTYNTSTNLTSSHVNPGTSTTYTVSKTDIENNKLVYTPNADSEADDSFTFKAYDGVTDSTSTYTISVSVNAAPNVTDATVGTVAAGAASSGDVHDGVADSDDADSALVVTAAKAASEGGSYSTVINLGNNSNLVTADTTSSNGLSVTGTYGTLVIGADGTYTYTASATNNIAYGATATDTFTFTTRDDETASGSFAYDVGELIFTVASSVSLVADTDTINEDATVTVANGATEDVLEDDTSATTVSHIGTVSNSLTEISTSQAITGTYGTLTMYATGAYSYVADQSEADALTAGVSANDVFYYKAAGATTTLTIAVTGIGPLAANDTANVNEDATAEGTGSVTGTGVLGNDDGNASYDTESLRVTRVSTDNFSTATTVDDDDNADTIDGTYGTLTIYKTGQYSYTPNNATAQALAASASATDTFYYEIKDDSDVNASTATIVFTITGQNDAPVADNETGAVNEDATLTVTDGASDVLYGDTDADDSSSLTATTYSHTSATNQSGGSASSGNSNSGTAGSGSVVGYYGTLTLAADGTYTYAADQNVTDALDAGDTVTDVFTYTVSDGTAT